MKTNTILATCLGAYGIINAVVVYLLIVLYPENAIFKALFAIIPPLTFEYFVTGFDYWNRMVLLSFEKKGLVIWMVIMYGMVARGIFGYLFVVYLEYGVLGIAYSEILSLGMRALSNLGLIYF